ncbi:MAG TPA: SDR family oxidoreductase [Hanamia sp.]|jgi:short-subunit dehydrogenase|nr:SDR family oxidoreductase [Hanamia sp.]
MFENKIVVITGGTDGIGKALVAGFLHKGASVSTCSRTEEKLSSLKKEFSGKSLFTMTADVSNEVDCRNFIERTLEHFGKIDILINNAGISMRAEFKDTDLDTLKKVMDINFWGAVYCTKFALDSIIKNKGSIVGVSSVAGFRGLPGRSGYSASKFALNGWLEALRTELLKTGVNVMWVCPGFTKSNIRNAALNKNAEPQKESPLEEDKLMTAEECALHIMNAIKKRKRTIVLTFTGKETVYLNKLFPGLADKLTHRFFYKNGELVK